MSRSTKKGVTFENWQEARTSFSGFSNLPPPAPNSQTENKHASTPSSPGTLRGDSPAAELQEFDSLSIDSPVLMSSDLLTWTRSPESAQPATPSSSAIRKRRREEDLSSLFPTPASRRLYPQSRDAFSSSQIRSRFAFFRRSQAPSISPPQLATPQTAIDLTQETHENVEVSPRDPRGISTTNTTALHFARNCPILMPHTEIKKLQWSEHTFLTNEKTVRLQSGEFLKIEKIIKHTVTAKVTLRGVLLRQNEKFDGQLPIQENELCMCFDVDLDDSRPFKVQALSEVGIEDVLQVCEVVYTNEAYPKHNNTEELHQIRIFERYPARYVSKHVVFACRRKYISCFETATRRQNIRKNPSHFFERAFMALDEAECTRGAFASPTDLRFAWRGDSMPGGSSLIRSKALPTGKITFVDMTEPGEQRKNSEFKSPNRKRPSNLSNLGPKNRARGSLGEQTYTFGDAFCSCGGMSSGAVKAGLRLLWGLDYNPQSTQTWIKNFGRDSTLFEMWVDQFFKLGMSREIIVDLLHLSPPCQPFSPAHTRQGQDDDMNRDSFLAVRELLKKTKPRVVTLEETFGLLHHMTYFNALISNITSLGFSVRWKVIAFKEFGLPQTRRRLIIIASCPGEQLPTFPKPTHSHQGISGRRPIATPREVLRQIPRNAPNNERRADSNRVRGVLRPDQLMPTITTHGTITHPDGKRECTAREIAALSGFFHDFEFVGTWTAVCKQIGNAVPPIFGEALYKHILKSLRAVDGID